MRWGWRLGGVDAGCLRVRARRWLRRLLRRVARRCGCMGRRRRRRACFEALTRSGDAYQRRRDTGGWSSTTDAKKQFRTAIAQPEASGACDACGTGCCCTSASTMRMRRTCSTRRWSTIRRMRRRICGLAMVSADGFDEQGSGVCGEGDCSWIRSWWRRMSCWRTWRSRIEDRTRR